MDEYLFNLIKALQALNLDILGKIVEALIKAKAIYLMGNGGSASTAEHFACDLVNVSGLKAVSLTANIPIITATANDCRYEDIFSRQLKLFLEPKDVVVAFSCSGESANILKAVEYAKRKKIATIGFTGFDTPLGKMAGFPIKIDALNIQMMEDIHLILSHAISLQLRNKICKKV